MRDILAVIADDEAPSRAHLKARLLEIWPELVICGEAANGLEALDLIRAVDPDVAFLDIRMPGLSGIEVARRTVGACRVVFITAYDRYAVDAFENEAVDYILKPALPERLVRTVNRLQSRIQRDEYTANLPRILAKLSALLDGDGDKNRFLKWIRVQVKGSVRLIPVEQVRFFQASNKVTLVMTADRETVIRKPISELAAELDPDLFFQIHRKTIVNAAFIEKVDTSATGRGLVKLAGRPEVHTVSRRYTHLFKQM